MDHTLQPTALVHEAWMRLATWRTDHALSEAEYHALASHVMRRVLTDHARRRATAKRGANRADAAVDVETLEQRGDTTVLEVDRLLRDLAEVDAELTEVVELRFFGGHTLVEIAELRGISLRTANRRWQLARAWLLAALSEDGTDGRADVGGPAGHGAGAQPGAPAEPGAGAPS